MNAEERAHMFIMVPAEPHAAHAPARRGILVTADAGPDTTDTRADDNGAGD